MTFVIPQSLTIKDPARLSDIASKFTDVILEIGKFVICLVSPV